ncbi:hypothetical protein BGX23_010266 [Mortierella sp. AD031]|nr:hypothetical protein BGX23_010266 [Mortierella sp. AD031]
MTSSKSLYKAIPALRGTICLLTLGCFITLFSYPKSPQDPFHILQQLGLNVCILFAYTYSLFGNSPRPLYPVYRMSLICTAFILSWVYGMGPLVRILGNQGCGATVYENAPGRCKMQVGVSSASVVWTVLMFCEGLMTDKRNRDKWYREQMGWEVVDDDHVLASRATARENAAATFGVVEYQPDLSLDGTVAGAGPAGPGGASRRRRAVDGDDEDGADLEMEPLPPYMPKARSNQPVIVDFCPHYNKDSNNNHRRNSSTTM